MPFRNAGAHGSQQYAAFVDPNGFDFGYDLGSGNLMSPYTFPLMSPDAACQYAPPISLASTMAFAPSPPPYSFSFPGTSASQQLASSNQSDSLSPLEANSFTTSPQDQDVKYPSSAGESIQSDENAAMRRSHLDMANAEVRSHGQKRNASHLGPDSPNADMAATGSLATQQQHTALASSKSPPAAPIKSRRSSTENSPERTHDEAVVLHTTEAATRARPADSAKVRHNIVERRYRENINTQVDLLRESIVATVHAKEQPQGMSASRLGADELRRLTKAAVIAAATKQIRRARTENERLLEEHRSLQAQVQQLESLVKCGDCPLMKLTVDLSLESPTQPP